MEEEVENNGLISLGKIILGGLIATGLALTLPMDLLLGAFTLGFVIPVAFLGAIFLMCEGLADLAMTAGSWTIGQDLKERISYYRDSLSENEFQVIVD